MGDKGTGSSQAGVPGSCSFEVCMANVLEGDMQRLRMRILGYLKPGGLFILSGMLAEQVRRLLSLLWCGSLRHAPAGCACQCGLTSCQFSEPALLVRCLRSWRTFPLISPPLRLRS
jgi:hypothetical protein